VGVDVLRNSWGRISVEVSDSKGYLTDFKLWLEAMEVNICFVVNTSLLQDTFMEPVYNIVIGNFIKQSI
jgi:hypothetical protein